jgi:ATP-binding cassette subfamily B protein
MVLTILVIIVILIGQAYCELSLPRVTSDIVDVGIMQGGIEDAVPNQIRRSSLNDLELFMPEDDIETVEKVYDENAEGILTFTAGRKDKETIETLNNIFEIPMLLFSASGSARTDSAVPGASDFDIEKIRAAAVAGMMSKAQLLEIRDKAEEVIGELGPLMSGTAAVGYVKAEYEALGVDMQDLQIDYMIAIAIKMLLFTVGAVAASITVCFLATRTASGLTKRLRKDMYFKILSFSSAEMDKFTGASLITRSTNDLQHIQMALIMMMRIVLFAPIMGIGGCILVVGTHSGMGWIAVVAVALLLLIVITLLTLTMPKFKILQTLVDRLNLVSREILTGLPVIRAFCRENFETKRFEKANEDLMKTQLFTNRAMSMMFPFMMLIMNGLSVVIVWFGGIRIDAGSLQVGDMMAFITYTIHIVISFLMISMIAVMLPRANVAAERVREVLATDVSILDKPEAELIKREKGDWQGLVEFHDVSFRFPDANEDVLEHISFSAVPGQTTAIIGSTGSGKSTLINLIPRLFDVTTGCITIDGVDIRDVSQHDLRRILGVVPQKGILFSGDIRSNLRFGSDEISDDEMVRAADIAQATEFIQEREGHYDSPISQGGTNVSGGQKQRLSIARAVTKDPKVFIFDDSFSALDYKTDSALRRALNANLGSTTVLIVAQRIATILHADKILVLDEGRIVGEGTHKELLENCEVYREIALSQLSQTELSA